MDAKPIQKGNIVDLAYEVISLIQRNNRSIEQIEKLIRDLHEFIDEPAQNDTCLDLASTQMSEQQKLEGNLILLVSKALELSIGETPRRKTEQIAKLIKTLQDFKDAPSINQKPMGSPFRIRPQRDTNFTGA